MANINIINGKIEMSTYAPYEGPYTVEPNNQQQILSTTNKKASDDISVEEIPDSYSVVMRDGDSLLFT